MSRSLFWFTLALLLSGASATNGWADENAPRQYYSEWHTHPQNRNVSYRNYYYKPSADYSGYKHHYVIKMPQDSEHVYYYNPYTQKYWGRLRLNSDENARYSLLAPKDRKGKLNEIPQSDFPPLGPMPPLPECTDKARLDSPPDDLPMAGFGL